MVTLSSSVQVIIVRAAGTPDETRIENVQMGGDYNTHAIFQPDADIKRGDEIHCGIFDEPRIVRRVVTDTSLDGGISSFRVTMQPLSDFKAAEARLNAGHTVQQNFHAPVGKVAGRDIVETNVTSITLLTVLENAVKQSKDIPEVEKASILEHLRSLATNPYVAGIATSAIFEGMKTLFT